MYQLHLTEIIFLATFLSDLFNYCLTLTIVYNSFKSGTSQMEHGNKKKKKQTTNKQIN